jgi:hypothetical protein
MATAHGEAGTIGSSGVQPLHSTGRKEGSREEFRCGALLSPAADPWSAADNRPLSVLDQTVAIPRRGPDDRLSSPALLEQPEGHPSQPEDRDRPERDAEGLHQQPWESWRDGDLPSKLVHADLLERQLEQHGPAEAAVTLHLTDDVYLSSYNWARWQLGIPLPVDE